MYCPEVKLWKELLALTKIAVSSKRHPSLEVVFVGHEEFRSVLAGQNDVIFRSIGGEGEKVRTNVFLTPDL